MFRPHGNFKKKEFGVKSADNPELNPETVRLILPKANQVFGMVEQRLGASRMNVRCFDGKKRVCRIPGRLKRHLWVREGDIVIIEPWEFCGDERGDIVIKYTKTQVEALERRGYLKKMKEFEEF